MNLNWGTGIVSSIIIFLLLSLAMVIHFMNQRVDLVTDNYYEKTLIYQNNINEAKRSSEIDKAFVLEYAGNQLKLVFPDSIASKLSDAELYFYRPSDSNLDFKTPIQVDKKGELVLDVSKINRGYWKVQMKWLMNKESYLVERTVIIN
jgi:hypothetical protein